MEIDMREASPEVQAMFEKLHGAVVALFQRVYDQGEELLKIAASLMREPPGAPAAIHRLCQLLPLVIRIEGLAWELNDEDGLDLSASEALAGELERGLAVLPTHGEGWATLAAWQSLQGQETLAVKHARHFGSESTYGEICEWLQNDGFFDQE